MLKKLLALIEKNNGYQVEDLARELNTTPKIITAMLGTLTRQGYLGKVEQTCSSACESCPLAKQCKVASKSSAQIWVLNPKSPPK